MPLIPIFADPLLGGDGGDVFPEFGVKNIPARSDMAIQPVGFILDQHGDGPNARIQAVAKGEIDDPYLPPKGTAGLARYCVSGESRSPLPPRENHGEHILHGPDSIRTNPK